MPWNLEVVDEADQGGNVRRSRENGIEELFRSDFADGSKTTTVCELSWGFTAIICVFPECVFAT